MSAASVRARVRAEMVEEIKATARRHLASDGADLSLRAVARDMGLVSSALYRYFASRDDLLTALIVDAYNAVGAAAQAGDAAITERPDLRGRWLSACHAVRDWAVAHPAEYALIFGSPVPGYAAPQDTIAAASRTPTVLLGILADAVDRGAAVPRDDRPGGDRTDDGLHDDDRTDDGLHGDLRADFERVGALMFPQLPAARFGRGSIAWVHLYGAISFEIFGHLNGVITDRRAYFDYQMRHLADLVGLS